MPLQTSQYSSWCTPRAGTWIAICWTRPVQKAGAVHMSKYRASSTHSTISFTFVLLSSTYAHCHTLSAEVSQIGATEMNRLCPAGFLEALLERFDVVPGPGLPVGWDSCIRLPPCCSREPGTKVREDWKNGWNHRNKKISHPVCVVDYIALAGNADLCVSCVYSYGRCR